MAVSKIRRGYETKMRGRDTNPEPMGLPDVLPTIAARAELFLETSKVQTFMVESQNCRAFLNITCLHY